MGDTNTLVKEDLESQRALPVRGDTARSRQSATWERACTGARRAGARSSTFSLQYSERHTAVVHKLLSLWYFVKAAKGLRQSSNSILPGS